MDSDFYRDLLDSLAEGIYFVDRDRHVRFWNRAAERLSGYAAREMLGERSADKILQHLAMLGGELCVQDYPLAATLEDGHVREAEVFLLHKFGHRVPVRVRATPVRGEGGTIVGAAEIFSPVDQDIDVLKELEALRKEVLTDPATGVGNRRFADLMLKTLEASWAGHGVPYGVLLAQVDRLAEVGGSHGPEAVDLVLRMVAQTLSRTLRSLDVVSHWGGGVFLLLAPIANENMLLGLAKRQRLLVENSAVTHAGESLPVTLCLGGAVSRQGEAAMDVLARAEAQLGRSMAAGGNRAHVDFSP